jgi:hypothetical protein
MNPSKVHKMATKEDYRDPRYRYVALLWKAEGFRSFKEILEIVPASTIAKDLGRNYGRFKPRVADPEKFKYSEVYEMAELLRIPFPDLSRLIEQAILKKKAIASSRYNPDVKRPK